MIKPLIIIALCCLVGCMQDQIRVDVSTIHQLESKVESTETNSNQFPIKAIVIGQCRRVGSSHRNQYVITIENRDIYIKNSSDMMLKTLHKLQTKQVIAKGKLSKKEFNISSLDHTPYRFELLIDSIHKK